MVATTQSHGRQAGNKVLAKKLFKKAATVEIWKGVLTVVELKAGNIATAKKFINKACEGGHMMACTNYGNLELQDGKILNAKSSWSRACDGGIAKACANMGTLALREGDKASAVKFYNKACNGGYTKACK